MGKAGRKKPGPKPKPKVIPGIPDTPENIARALFGENRKPVDEDLPKREIGVEQEGIEPSPSG